MLGKRKKPKGRPPLPREAPKTPVQLLGDALQYAHKRQWDECYENLKLLPYIQGKDNTSASDAELDIWPDIMGKLYQADTARYTCFISNAYEKMRYADDGAENGREQKIKTLGVFLETLKAQATELVHIDAQGALDFCKGFDDRHIQKSLLTEIFKYDDCLMDALGTETFFDVISYNIGNERRLELIRKYLSDICAVKEDSFVENIRRHLSYEDDFGDPDVIDALEQRLVQFPEMPDAANIIAMKDHCLEVFNKMADYKDTKHNVLNLGADHLQDCFHKVAQHRPDNFVPLAIDVCQNLNNGLYEMSIFTSAVLHTTDTISHEYDVNIALNVLTQVIAMCENYSHCGHLQSLCKDKRDLMKQSLRLEY